MKYNEPTIKQACIGCPELEACLRLDKQLTNTLEQNDGFLEAANNIMFETTDQFFDNVSLVNTFRDEIVQDARNILDTLDKFPGSASLTVEQFLELHGNDDTKPGSKAFNSRFSGLDLSAIPLEIAMQAVVGGIKSLDTHKEENENEGSRVSVNDALTVFDQSDATLEDLNSLSSEMKEERDENRCQMETRQVNCDGVVTTRSRLLRQIKYACGARATAATIENS